jgi:phospholipid/cholesterol/gamma-HCH transport system ATP-binding protein
VHNAETLAFDRVSVHFDEAVALNAVSFRVEAGESLIVLGAAGSGKTVLLKVALGLLRADAGQVRAFGQDVTAMPESGWFDIRSKVGVLFQEGGLFDSLTIEENVAYPLRNQHRITVPEEQIEARVEESLRFVELSHTLEKIPSELSGGMRRRVGIARAVVTNPELLLYDSPTAGLDPITANTIMALIVKGRDLHNNTTVMVTHRYQDGQILSGYHFDPNTGKLRKVADGDSTRTRFLVLKDGQVVFDGSQQELEASPDAYLRMFVRQEPQRGPAVGF